MNNKVKISSLFAAFLYLNVTHADPSYGVFADCRFDNVQSANKDKFRLYVTADLINIAERKSLLPPGFLANTTIEEVDSINLRAGFYFIGQGKAEGGYVVYPETWSKLITSLPNWTIYEVGKKNIYTNQHAKPELYTAMQLFTKFNIKPEETMITGDGTLKNPFSLTSIGDSNDWKIVRISAGNWQLQGKIYGGSDGLKVIQLSATGICTLVTEQIPFDPNKIIRDKFVDDIKK